MIEYRPVPISFSSKKLPQTQERDYSFDRELFAAYLAVLNFIYLIEGRDTLLHPSHKSSSRNITRHLELNLDIQQRHLNFINDYVTDVSPLVGHENTDADYLP